MHDNKGHVVLEARNAGHHGRLCAVGDYADEGPSAKTGVPKGQRLAPLIRPKQLPSARTNHFGQRNTEVDVKLVQGRGVGRQHPRGGTRHLRPADGEAPNRLQLCSARCVTRPWPTQRTSRQAGRRAGRRGYQVRGWMGGWKGVETARSLKKPSHRHRHIHNGCRGEAGVGVKGMGGTGREWGVGGWVGGGVGE